MQLNRVVVGMDFSAPAIGAAKWVAEHFAPTAELMLVHAIDVPTTPAFMRGVLPPDDVIEAAARDHAEARLRDLAILIPAQILRTEIRVGAAHAVLTDVAEESGADLLVVGQHGDRPRPWKPLGTTAERLVRSSPVPVLVATNPGATAPRRMLAPVDVSDTTPNVLAWARFLAESFNGEVTVMHVLSGGAYSHVVAMGEVLTGEDEVAAEQLRGVMRDAGVRWLEKLASTGIGQERATAAVTFGWPGDAIVTMAASMQAELIVVGRRGRSALAAAVLGSTVSTVLYGAQCPVLVIAGPRDRAGA